MKYALQQNTYNGKYRVMTKNSCSHRSTWVVGYFYKSDNPTAKGFGEPIENAFDTKEAALELIATEQKKNAEVDAILGGWDNVTTEEVI